MDGYRQYCPEAKGQKYGEREQGAFGDFVVKNQDFVYPVPEGIESQYAGPLMCAGVSALAEYLGTFIADAVGGYRVRSTSCSWCKAK